MSLEAVKKVNLAEQQAKDMKVQSLQDAKKLVTEAEKNGVQLVEAARSKARVENAQRMAQAEANAAAHLAQVIRETERACDALRSEAQGELAKAASLIVRRVVDS